MRKLIFWGQVLCISMVQATYTPQIAQKSNLSNVAYAAKNILQDIGLVFGIGMVLGGVYKYTEHRENPMANPLGRVFTLILAGAALIGVYFVPMPHITS